MLRVRGEWINEKEKTQILQTSSNPPSEVAKALSDKRLVYSP